MFDLGWTELVFCGVLALILVGPKDLPKLMRLIGGIVRRIKSLYRDVQMGLGTLEKEIDLASGADTTESWVGYVPEEIRKLPEYLPENYVPGTMSAEEHAKRREKYELKLQELKQLAAERRAASEAPK
ncbi:Sec-independent protein translocase subunit TatA/TatB [Methylocaldum szegediense]|jgi:sec-independent protein translocase protein TatB|uniref:Sec-independent protein translocase protein TatB n=1 Tax=Methylocaldum szegediense TaxID=73780 RepID=A0ABN8X058_9GAMM|nr:twin-arginine translocase TatA/TatE family subunit [Methylocaldum szegediense]CAI8790428.1 putative Sec-independent protein translocase protein TatB [Methylocaldum szegediense]